MFFSANSKSLQKIANALLLQMSENDVLILAGNANYTTYPNATCSLDFNSAFELRYCCHAISSMYR